MIKRSRSLSGLASPLACEPNKTILYGATNRQDTVHDFLQEFVRHRWILQCPAHEVPSLTLLQTIHCSLDHGRIQNSVTQGFFTVRVF